MQHLVWVPRTELGSSPQHFLAGASWGPALAFVHFLCNVHFSTSSPKGVSSLFHSGSASFSPWRQMLFCYCLLRVIEAEKQMHVAKPSQRASGGHLSHCLCLSNLRTAVASFSLLTSSAGRPPCAVSPCVGCICTKHQKGKLCGTASRSGVSDSHSQTPGPPGPDFYLSMMLSRSPLGRIHASVKINFVVSVTRFHVSEPRLDQGSLGSVPGEQHMVSIRSVPF